MRAKHPMPGRVAVKTGLFSSAGPVRLGAQPVTDGQGRPRVTGGGRALEPVWSAATRFLDGARDQ